MAVFEFKVEVALAAVSAIEELLGEREEQQLMVIEDKPSGRAWLTGYFDSKESARANWDRFSELLDAEWLITEPAISELADQDWKESYKEHFKAWKFGPLHWVPIWERDVYRISSGERVLWLDPGMAFGTGNHETTRLVVERLIEVTANRGVGGRVIDAGCGSGILALSAAKLGYAQVAAFDNDPLAVEISRENATLNGLENAVEFYVADLANGLGGRQADVVLANIQADVLIKFSGQLLGSLAVGGTLILSGILTTELSQVRDKFVRLAPRWGISSHELGEWSDLVLTKP